MSDNQYTDKEYQTALRNAQGRDKIGVVAEIVTTGAGTAGGYAASTAIASVAGATSTSFIGSTFLGGLLGVGTVITPVGWVVGSAVAGTALAYGVTQLVKSGARSDKMREDVSAEIRQKRKNEILGGRRKVHLSQLIESLKECSEKGVLSKEKAAQILVLVKNEKLNLSVARRRVRCLLER